jgi:hypothetical protein
MSIDYRVTFGAYNYGAKWKDADGSDLTTSVSNENLEISNVELVLQIIQLTEESEAVIKKMGNYNTT